MKKLLEAQKHLKEYQLDGWLLYDFNHSNPLALEFLDIPQETHLSRRLFYWIPVEGDPTLLVHKIEPYVLDHMPGKKRTYQTKEELHRVLQDILKNAKQIAMEYSPFNELPYVSKVDAGTFEMVAAFNIKIVSSGPFLQYFTALLNNEQKRSQQEAGKFLDFIAEETFSYALNRLSIQEAVTEYQLQQWVLNKFHEAGFMTDCAPICAFGAHTADPHYSPKKEGSSALQANQLILLDFVAKKNQKGSVYGDITRMGFSGKQVPQKCQMVFALAQEAQRKGFEFIQKRFERREIVKGYEVDQICRQVIQAAGYGDYFTHRTGHNIDARAVHGSGAHLDGFETEDTRPLLPHTCFTIEPGIYFPNEWGVRVEYDVLIHENYKLEITSGVQDAIRVL